MQKPTLAAAWTIDCRGQEWKQKAVVGGRDMGQIWEHILEVLLMRFSDALNEGGRDKEKSRMTPKFGAQAG